MSSLHVASMAPCAGPHAEQIDQPRLLQRAEYYASKAGAGAATLAQLRGMLQSGVGRRILQLSNEQLHSYLVNDAYKVRMQAMYAEYFTGVTADFALNVRRTPLPIAAMREAHPDVFASLEACTAALQRWQPYPEAVREVIWEYMGLEVTERMLQRAVVAPVEWLQAPNGQLIALASGSLEAASNVETSCMQLVQEHTLAAQVEKLCIHCEQQQRHHQAEQQQRQQQQQQQQSGSASILQPAGSTPASSGASEAEPATTGMSAEAGAAAAAGAGAAMAQAPCWLDRTERLANSLGTMAARVERLNELKHGCTIMVMAGRRSSDLLHLLLQNLYFMHHADGYVGTSSIATLALLQPIFKAEGLDAAACNALVGRLMGTHAHEMGSAVQQLCAVFDEDAGRHAGADGPLCVTQLLSHLLFLTANGGLSGATALPDTFTTAGFVAAALAAELPPEFVEDVERRWGDPLPAGGKVFDLFRVWRMDSGDYRETAQLVVGAWEERCAALAAEGRPPLPPITLLHSNIDALDDIVAAAALPKRLRPRMLGFGGLTDGFQPFELPQEGAAGARTGGNSSGADTNAGTGACAGLSAGPSIGAGAGVEEAGTAQLAMASLVMKLVQARPPAAVAAAATVQACAVKLGDGSGGKMQVDPRLEAAAAAQLRQQMGAMAARTAALRGAEGEAVLRVQRALSNSLREAYVSVTRQGLLQQG